jgi:N-acetylneuraminate synthase
MTKDIDLPSGATARDVSIHIADKRVGAGSPAYLIAEVAQAHDGSLGLAHQFIDAAAEAGVDAIKFQTHFASEESTLDEPFRVKFSKQDDTRFAYWKRMEFTDEQWAGLFEHAREKGLHLLSSAFSTRAFELLDRLGMPAWKIASGEVASDDLILRMAATGKPVLLSTGMSSYDEISNTVALLRAKGAPLAIFQCTSRYPTPLEQVGLNVIDEIRSRFGCPAGLSDHSGVVFPSIFAMARGANLIEAHITLDRRMFGPDVASSLTVEEFSLVRNARDGLVTMDAHPVQKDAVAEELKQMRELFQKSLAVKQAVSAGEILTRDLLTTKKPGTGISAREIDKVLGRRLVRGVSPDRVLTWDDMDE